MSYPLEVDIAIEAGDWPSALENLAHSVVGTAIAKSRRDLAGPAELSILLTDDIHQKALNAQWRGKDKTTNVLSFPQIEPDEPVSGLLGDISLAYETLMAEAGALEKPFEHHFAHLLVHGCLHILGFDHESEDEALVMEALETDIMAQLGYPDPYDGQDLDLG